MSLNAEVNGDTPDIAHAHADTRPRERLRIWLLLSFQSMGILFQVTAVWLSREDVPGIPLPLACAAYALTFASALWVLTSADLGRAARNAAVVCLGLVTTLEWRSTNPLLFTGFDEQLHLRTLTDLETSHSLFQSHPMLAVSSHYPGLEALAALGEQGGLSMVAAATVVVLLARLAFVLVLCDAAEQLTGSVRAGGLAVAAYAGSAQFVFFNSQFAYQSLALPLGLAAVALIARSRHAADARVLLAAAAVCLCAVAVTHHVTSFLTAAFLVVWAAVERRGPAGRRIRFGALVAVSSTAVWAMVQWSLLRDYFGPIILDLFSQARNSEGRRAAFVDPSGVPTPRWEQAFLLYYAALMTVAAVTLLLKALKPGQSRRLAEPRRMRSPRTLLLLPVALVPVLFAARVLPSGGEFGDRATSFVYLPFSVLAAETVVLWARGRRPRPVLRWTALILATCAFLGGYLLGGGPDWARLPGPYLVSADGRSMDSDTLAAVDWAKHNLPAGSRIGADRVNSALLASRARLWPVLGQDKLDPASLYFADHWGQPQTDAVRDLSLRYLYVDDRLADGLPHVATYFHRGETAAPQRLTRAQLEKFDRVPGIEIAYRHGPISIYDLSALGVPDLRSGWSGQVTATSPLVQIAAGLVIALGLVLVANAGWSTVITGATRNLRSAAGPALTFAVVLATTCIGATILLLFHVWLGPWTFGLVFCGLIVVGRRWLDARRQLLSTKISWLTSLAALALAVPVTIAAFLSVASAHAADTGTAQPLSGASYIAHDGSR